jgi:CheY-like chemotaxis protein
VETDKRHILYLEDHDDSRTFTTFLLKDAGYQITPVVTIAEAQATLEDASSHSPFDLYILDYLLEDGAGITLCEQMRLLDAAVPIVFLSGAVREQDKQKAKDAGATEFIEKPFDSAELLKVVERLCC